jgi:1,4-dihydroxy-2-naphthoate octaprenyltransferase
LIAGAVCVLAYTPFITKTVWPEWAAGVGLGSLPVLGTYFVQTTTYTIPAVIGSIPSAILVHNLLLLNELPDVEADGTAGKRTLPIVIGRTRAGQVYSFLAIAVYGWIVAAVLLDMMPVPTLLALLALPLAIKAINGARSPEDMERLVPAMANNVLMVLLTQALLGLGYIVAGVLQI